MSAKTSLTVHPQAESLRNRNRQLQAEAARLIGERDELQNVVAPQIEVEYRSVFGAAELRVFQFECEIRALIRRIEVANSSLNRGEKPIYDDIEREIKTEFAAWRENIARQIREIRIAKEMQNLPTLTRPESLELKSLYRKLALILHEDITGTSDERSRKLWLQAAEAYRNGDLPTLRTIRLLVGDDLGEISRATENSSLLDGLKNRHAALKNLCEKLLDEIAAVKTSAPYIWHEILGDAAEVLRRQNDLRDQLEILREQRRQLIADWSEIMRFFVSDDDKIEIPAEPPDVFAEDDWAEIIYRF